MSNNEKDALLAALTEDASAPQDDIRQPALAGVHAYNLGATERVVRRRMQTLELINERFIGQLRGVLLNFIRRNADISVGAIEVVKYSEFERNLPVPCNLNMVKLNPLRGVALFAFDPALVSLVIDSMFGGQAKAVTQVEGRDFTATELRIIKKLLEQTLECYTKSWTGVYEITHTYMRSEMHTKFASITSGNEAVVVTPIRIEFGSISGSLKVCMPYSMIEPIRSLLTNPHQEADKHDVDSRWANQLSSQIRNTQVSLVAHLTELELTIADLLALEKGSVLPFDRPETVTAYINKVPALRCGYGIYNKHFALEVQEHLQEPSFDYFLEKRDA